MRSDVENEFDSDGIATDQTKMTMAIKMIFITLLFALFNMQYSYGQTVAEAHENTSAISRFIYNEKIALKLDYFGELVLHPGITVGVDYTLSEKKWVTLHWNTELGGYWHRWNNTALFLKSSIGTRFPIKSLFVDLNLGAGYMHSFPAGKIYQRAADGSVERAANWGSPHFMPAFSVLFGFDGTRNYDLPFTIHAGVEAYLQSSFNHIFLPHAAAKVGMTYQFRRK